jgi:hypothetical protein
MKSCYTVAFAACALGLAAAAPTSASALPMAPLTAHISDSMVTDVQYRRGRPVHRPVARRNSRGGLALGLGAAAVIGAIGAAALARPSYGYEQPAYGYPVQGGYAPAYGYEDPYAPQQFYARPRPSPFCHIEQQQVFDAWGNRVGARNVRVCR